MTDESTAKRLVSTGITGIYRLCRAYERRLAVCDDDESRLYELEWLEHELARVDDALTVARNWIAERHAEIRKRARVAALRNVDGREPAEAAAYLAKADELARGG